MFFFMNKNAGCLYHVRCYAGANSPNTGYLRITTNWVYDKDTTATITTKIIRPAAYAPH